MGFFDNIFNTAKELDSERNFEYGELVCHEDVPRICKFGGVGYGGDAVLLDKTESGVEEIHKPYDEVFSLSSAEAAAEQQAVNDHFNSTGESS